MYYNNRGVALLRKRDFDRALKDFDKAIEMDSRFWSAYQNRGMAYSGKGLHDKAVEEFSKVIEVNPDSSLLYKDRGTAYLRLGDYESAIKDFDKAIELDKKFAPAYAALGLLRALAEKPYKDRRKALRLAEKAVKLSGGKSPDMIQNLARVQHALNRPKEAIRSLERAYALDPGNREYAELMREWKGSAPTLESRKARRGEGRFSDLW
jgi:tetratricopeptide (TPR) repeat protein